MDNRSWLYTREGYYPDTGTILAVAFHVGINLDETANLEPGY